MLRIVEKIRLLEELRDQLASNVCRDIITIQSNLGYINVEDPINLWTSETDDTLNYLTSNPDQDNSSINYAISTIIDSTNRSFKLEHTIDNLLRSGYRLLAECRRTQSGVRSIQSRFKERYYEPGGPYENLGSQRFQNRQPTNKS